MNISFDWDHTLSSKEVQDLATLLAHMGFNVYIVTSRYDEETAIEKFGSKRFSNSSIFDFVSSLGIPESNVVFTNMKDKAEFFYKNSNFLFHLDDDEIEIDLINKNTEVNGILKKDNDDSWRDVIFSLVKKNI